MSFKGLKATVKIKKIEKFRDLLTEGKEEFNGTLDYDEQGYSNNFEDLTFGDSKTYVLRGSQFILPEENEALKKAIIEANKEETVIEEGDKKTILTALMIDDGFLLCSLYEECLIGEVCQVLYKGKIFNAIIKYIGPSCS